MKILMMWCPLCKKCTEHERVKTVVGPMITCLKCTRLHEEQRADKVRNPFGARGRGF